MIRSVFPLSEGESSVKVIGFKLAKKIKDVEELTVYIIPLAEEPLVDQSYLIYVSSESTYSKMLS